MEWAALYGRDIKQGAIDVWIRIFVNADLHVLAKALELVTETAERMPTPGHLTKAISQVQDSMLCAMPDQYTYRKVVAKDSGTGEMVNAVVYDVDKDNTVCFRAQDCPEGREFLNALHRISGKLEIPFPKPDADASWELERQRQKNEYAEALKARQAQ